MDPPLHAAKVDAKIGEFEQSAASPFAAQLSAAALNSLTN
jgi:hypothetical protein